MEFEFAKNKLFNFRSTNILMLIIATFDAGIPFQIILSFTDMKNLKNIRIPAFMKNRYFISIMVFLVWLTFFDKNDFVTQYTYRKQLNELNKDKAYYTEEIAKNKKELFELMSDSVQLEKFAREKYLMKKDNEEIFVIVPEHNTEETEYAE